MELEDRLIVALGCLCAAAAVACILPGSRRVLAERIRPQVRRARGVSASEVAKVASTAAAQAAAIEGGRRALGV